MILGAFINWRYRTVWANEFDNNYQDVITPEVDTVLEATDEVTKGSTQHQTVLNIWDWTSDNISYRLTESWRTPSEVIQSGYGDCEDYSFVITSMALAFGVDYVNLLLGRLKYPDKSRPPENHVWLEHNGRVIDGTTSRNTIDDSSRYVEVDTYKIINKMGLENFRARG